MCVACGRSDYCQMKIKLETTIKKRQQYCQQKVNIKSMSQHGWIYLGLLMFVFQGAVTIKYVPKEQSNLAIARFWKNRLLADRNNENNNNYADTRMYNIMKMPMIIYSSNPGHFNDIVTRIANTNQRKWYLF